MSCDFQNYLKEELNGFLFAQYHRYPADEVLKMDLHCHDLNSDVPDELIGRILNVPETWLPSNKLLEKLSRNECDTFTITNHNNARSCYALQEQGHDVLTGAEFSCLVPDFGIGIHVLAYGFTPEQEVRLEKLRKNVYSFLEYARLQDIPTIWAHPLYHYGGGKTPPMTFYRKMKLVFERFEVLNGQRDTWQNLLVREWLEKTSKAEIDKDAEEFGIDPLQYCADPYRKTMSGGSDCHMGVFAGATGTYLYVPGLKERLHTESRSQLALEAIREGRMAPYGTFQNAEKMTLAFLDYACQIALNYKDPGLLRLLLHKGNTNEKLISLLVSNFFSEVQRHKVTTSFIRIFHESIMGEKPPFLKKMLIKPVYMPVFNEAVRIADTWKKEGNELVQEYYGSIQRIHTQFYTILGKRLEKKLKKNTFSEIGNGGSLNAWIEKLELPSALRTYWGDEGKESKSTKGMNLAEFLDGLSFPAFGALFIQAAHFISAKTLFESRPSLKQFSHELGRLEHPERILWLTDTYGENNGVSVFLQEVHAEIRKRDLPIDIVTCSSHARSAEHLIVLPPKGEFSLPLYGEYTFKVPDLVELHNLFLSGGYDRIICSTEGIMGMFGLYLKHAYTVEASFYMHTDWLMFARKVLHIEGANLSRVRRILRFFYQSFDRVLVLNSDQKKWLSGMQMNLSPDRVFQTAHWVNPRFAPTFPIKKRYFGIPEDCPVLLYVGRVSEEKGVMELTSIYAHARQHHEKVKLVVAGTGPALKKLQYENPDAIYLNWVDRDELPAIYSSADLLVLPSRFDTFCNAVLEALSCGLPVVAYDTKGPKDIIRNGEDGFLVQSLQEMQHSVSAYLGNQEKAHFRRAATERASIYRPEAILDALLKNVGLHDTK